MNKGCKFIIDNIKSLKTINKYMISFHVTSRDKGYFYRFIKFIIDINNKQYIYYIIGIMY